MYRLRWWIGGIVARLVTLVMFKDVEVTGSAAHAGPRLVVANHFGGLVDAIVVVRALGGLPHIVAKSTLFKRLPLRILLRTLGVVPVYRRSDHSDMSKNTSSFDEVAKALGRGRTVLIFPEGTVTDTQELQRVRTGTARMAARAIETGTSGLGVVPLGITYEDKVSTRSRVLVEVGDRIDDEEIRALAAGSPITEGNHTFVEALTDTIRERLTEVSPDYGSLIRERIMMLAASVRLRTSMTKAYDEPTMGELRSVAQHLGTATRGRDDTTLTETGAYQLALAASGLEDEAVQPTPRLRDLAAVAARKALIVLVVAPLALFGLVANTLAILLVVAVGAFVKEPVSKGTARVIAGVVAFPLMWVLLALGNTQYWWLTLTLQFVGLVFLILLVTQALDLFEALQAWWRVRNHLALIPDLRSIRERADAELVDLLGDPGIEGPADRPRPAG